MQIELRINGEKKSFVTPFIKGRIFRKALKLNKSLTGSELNEEQLDQLVEFVCDVFDGRFSPDDVYDGLELRGLLTKLQSVLVEVIETATDGIVGTSDSATPR
jgi:hypothetical protein